jgi:hypothetical protein
MQLGKIRVSANSVPDSNSVKIEIELQCSVDIWREGLEKVNQPSEITKEEIKEISQSITLSPSMKLLLSQTLIESMGGRLEILDVSPNDSQDAWTRIILICQAATRG